MAGSAVVSVSILLFVLLATAAAATPTDVAIDEAYAHLVNVTGDQEHWAERAEVARAYNRAAYMSDPVAVMDRFEDGGVRTDEAATVRSPSLPRKFRAGARPPTPSTSAGGGAAATGPGTTGSAWPGAPSASAATRPTAGSPASSTSSPTPPTTPPASSPSNRGNLRHAVVEDRPLWITFARDMV